MNELEEKTGYEYSVLYEGTTSDRYNENHKKLRQAVIALTSDDVFTVIVRKRYEGVSKNNIPWSKWSDEYKLIFSFRPKGKSKKKSFNVYTWMKIRGGKSLFTNSSPGLRERNSIANLLPYDRAEDANQLEITIMEHVFTMYRKHIGPIDSNVEPVLSNIPFLSYPLIKHTMTPNQPMYIINPKVRQAYRSETFEELTVKLFGKRLYRKDLVKAVASGNVNILGNFLPFKNSVPIDWIITELKDSAKLDTSRGYAQSYHIDATYKAQLNNIFNACSKSTQKKLLRDIKETPNNVSHYMKDASSLYIQINSLVLEDKEEFISEAALKVSSWKELHDNLSTIHRRIRTRDKVIPQTEKALKLEEIFSEDDIYQIKPAKTTHELIRWGELMSNCISSYADSAVNGRTLLAKVEKDNELIANIEIVGNKCRQLYGKYNRPLPQEEHDLVVKKLLEAKIISTAPRYYSY
jgi:hypothetical protein